MFIRIAESYRGYRDLLDSEEGSRDGRGWCREELKSLIITPNTTIDHIGPRPFTWVWRSHAYQCGFEYAVMRYLAERKQEIGYSMNYDE